MEEWKDISGYEGLYQISNLGRVKNNKNRILLNFQDKDGYYRIKLSKNNITKGFLIHRLIAIAFIDNSNNLPCIDHIDRNTSNNNLSNLRWSSYLDNNLNRNITTKINSNSKHKNIYITPFNSYRVIIRRNKIIIYDKSFEFIEDAINYRDEILPNLNDD